MCSQIKDEPPPPLIHLGVSFFSLFLGGDGRFSCWFPLIHPKRPEKIRPFVGTLLAAFLKVRQAEPNKARTYQVWAATGFTLLYLGCRLDCDWVGSLDFNFLGSNTLNPPKSYLNLLQRGQQQQVVSRRGDGVRVA